MRQIGELQERIPNLTENDPVVHMRHVTLPHDHNERENVEKQFTASRRASGQLDLYWNCKLIYSSDKDQHKQKFEMINRRRTEVNEHTKY